MQDVQHINLPVHDWILIAVQWIQQSFFEQEGQYQQYCGGVHSPSRVNFSYAPFPQIQKLIVLRFTYLFFELVEIVEIQGQLQLRLRFVSFSQFYCRDQWCLWFACLLCDLIQNTIEITFLISWCLRFRYCVSLRYLHRWDGLSGWFVLFRVFLHGFAVVLQREVRYYRFLRLLNAPVYLLISGFRLIRLHQLVLIVPYAELKFKFPRKELEDAVLSHLLRDFICSVDADVDEYLEQRHHQTLLVVAVTIVRYDLRGLRSSYL